MWSLMKRAVLRISRGQLLCPQVAFPKRTYACQRSAQSCAQLCTVVVLSYARTPGKFKTLRAGGSEQVERHLGTRHATCGTGLVPEMDASAAPSMRDPPAVHQATHAVTIPWEDISFLVPAELAEDPDSVKSISLRIRQFNIRYQFYIRTFVHIITSCDGTHLKVLVSCRKYFHKVVENHRPVIARS